MLMQKKLYIFVLTCSVLLINLIIIHADAEEVKILNKEIMKALENCGETKQDREEAKEEFNRRASTPSMQGGRSKRSDNGYGEEKTLENGESGEWDDEDSDAGHGKPWNNPKDDKYNIDGVYSHNRRNNTQTGNNTQTTKSIQDQNKTKSGYIENNFDSRGGMKHFRQNYDGDDYNRTSVNMRFDRMKRDISIMKSAISNEVDERGIPKEALFLKLIQDNVMSQQSKGLIEKLIQSCFKELQHESEENGCLYSNALEKCMKLQLQNAKNTENEQPEE